MASRPACHGAADGQRERPGNEPVTLGTSAGQIDLTLDRDLAPCTVNSFVSLAKQGYFDNTPCHG